MKYTKVYFEKVTAKAVFIFCLKTNSMAITKQKKESLISELDGLLKGAASLVFVKFKRLPVAETTIFRRNLRDAKVGYKVAKKTLMKRVLNSKSISGEMPDLEGEVAIAYGDDLLAPAREVYTFIGTHKENVEIIGGMFDGRYMSKDEMMSIATIPPVGVLYSQFVNLINSPLQRFAVVLDQIAQTKTNA